MGRVQINPAQQLSVKRHHNRRQRHQHRSSSRGKQNAARGEHAGGQGHGQDVVTGRPDEVLDHLAVAGLRELNHRQYCPGIITGQDHSGGFHCHIRAGPDGDADLGAGQGRGVVDTVADHGHAQATLL